MTGAHTPSVADVLAFPSRVDRPMPGGGSYRDDRPGMTLRDYFAGQALAGLLGNDLDGPPGKGIAGHTDHFAILSYRYADAMLAARATSKEAQGNE